ncbi:universal stress protein [Chloroflexota bacterium]
MMEEKIVVPLDGSKVGESALPYVQGLVSKLLPNLKVEVILLQVLKMAPPVATYGASDISLNNYTEKQMEENKKNAEDYLNKIGETLRSKGAEITARVVIGNTAEEIVKVAEEMNANLIAMSTHGRSGLSRWAFGSVTDKVLKLEGRIPITMVKAQK